MAGWILEWGGGMGNLIWKIIFAFHMPLMFAISGSVSDEERIRNMKGKKSCSGYLLKCVVNLYGSYLFFGYVYWSVKFFLYQGNRVVSVSDAIRLPFDSSGWEAGWYLMALLIIKILDFLIVKGISRKEIRAVIWILLFLFGRHIPVAFIADACSYGIYFQLGRRWKNEKFENPQILIGVLALAGILKYEGIYVFLMNFVIAAALCEIVIIVMVQAKEKRMLFFEEMGMYSMIPYALHAYFTIPVRVVLEKINCGSFSIFVLAGFLSAILFSYLIILLVKRFPKIKHVFYPI